MFDGTTTVALPRLSRPGIGQTVVRLGCWTGYEASRFTASSSSSSSSSAAGAAVAEPETAAEEAPAAANGHHANGRAKGGGGRRAAEAARLAAAEAELERSVRHGRALRAAAVSYRGHADELSRAVATLEPLAVSVDASAARPPRDPLPPLPPEEPPPDG